MTSWIIIEYPDGELRWAKKVPSGTYERTVNPRTVDALRDVCDWTVGLYRGLIGASGIDAFAFEGLNRCSSEDPCINPTLEWSFEFDDFARFELWCDWHRPSEALTVGEAFAYSPHEDHQRKCVPPLLLALSDHFAEYDPEPSFDLAHEVNLFLKEEGAPDEVRLGRRVVARIGLKLDHFLGFDRPQGRPKSNGVSH